MFKNYLITAYRNFFRNKTYTLLSLSGLSLGIASAIAIYTFLTIQLSFDKHQTGYDQIYRVISHYQSGDQDAKFSTVPHPLGEAIRSEVPGLAATSNTFFLTAQVNVPNPDGSFKKFKQDNIGFGYPDLFEILDFKWLAGSTEGLLIEPTGIAINASLAQKFFDITTDYQQVIGRTLNLANKHNLTIKAVYQDFPISTDFPFYIITGYFNQEGVNQYFGEGKMWPRLNGNTQCLVKLDASADPTQVEQNIKTVVEQYNTIEGYSVELQPLREVHKTEYGNYSRQSISDQVINVAIAIAVLLVLISSINFINISTARAVKRAREVGIRKVMGGLRSGLISQFMIESMILVILAHFIGYLLAEPILGLISGLMEFPMSLSSIPWQIWVGFFGVSIPVISVLAGLYPALIISGFSPIEAMKSKLSNIEKQGSFPLRKLLVGTQFAVSIMLIMGTLVVMKQLYFMQKKDVGFRQNQIITLEFPQPDYGRQTILKTKVENIPGVEKVSLNLGSPVASTNNTDRYYNPEVGEHELFTVNDKIIDENYLDLFDLQLLAGRNVTPADDLFKIVVTAGLLDKMGIEEPQDAIGKSLHSAWGQKYQIIGVVNDFNPNSFHQEIMPVLMRYGKDYFYEMSIRLASGNLQTTSYVLTQINETWDQVLPELMIEYDFLDQRIANKYKVESSIAKMLNFFAFMAIFICAIGLYGLTDFMANARKKEIGVRKIVGASIGQILLIFLKEVSWIFLMAFALAATATYHLMQKWLEGYAYRIEIDWKIVALSFLATVLVTFATMGWRSFKAATLNMVEVLKDE